VSEELYKQSLKFYTHDLSEIDFDEGFFERYEFPEGLTLEEAN